MTRWSFPRGCGFAHSRVHLGVLGLIPSMQSRGTDPALLPILAGPGNLSPAERRGRVVVVGIAPVAVQAQFDVTRPARRRVQIIAHSEQGRGPTCRGCSRWRRPGRST